MKCKAGHGPALERMYKNWIDTPNIPKSIYARRPGPGTRLYRMLRDGWGMTASGCTCAEWIARMNMWGEEQCLERIDEITDHLLEEARNNPMVPRAIRSALNFPIIGEIAGRLRLNSLIRTAIDKPVDPVFETVEDPLGELPILKGPAVGYREQHLRALSAMVEKKFPVPDTFNGDGVLIIGGGKYWPGIVVSIEMLRRTGCNLPVQVWHRGEEEACDLSDLTDATGVTLVDTLTFAAENGGYRMMGGWESKLYALSHCNFRRVLYLDADAYVVGDPTPLMEKLSEAPFLFWQDLPGQEKSVKWSYVWPNGDNGVPAIQGGQLFIDIEKCWKVIQVAHWMNQHADFYYQYMYGDQDTWRVAFAAVGDNTLWKNLGNAPWANSIAFVLRDEHDKPLIIHRCRGKLFMPRDIPDGNTQYLAPHYDLPYEADVFTILAGVKSRTLSRQRTFDTIYEKKLWGIGSGRGSHPSESAPYIDFVISFMRLHGLKSILDLGCGDGRVGSNFQCEYTGVDVHAAQLEKLRRRYPEKQWIEADFFEQIEGLPPADLILCKDVLHHWPNWMVRDFLTRLRKLNKWEVALFCQDRLQVSPTADCPLGSYRAVNWKMPPLSEFPVVGEYTFLHKEVVSLPLK